MHLWAESYERDVSEVLELQREVAIDIARRIDVVYGRSIGRASSSPRPTVST